MSDNGNHHRWRPGGRDLIFLAVVVVVVVVLSLGSKERRTAATPGDETHAAATTRKACMGCHGEGGVSPRPAGHTRADQCFQCHPQPENWRGSQ